MYDKSDEKLDQNTMNKEKPINHHVGPPRLLNYNCEVPTEESKPSHCLLTLEVEDKTFYSSTNSNTIKLKLKTSTLDTLLGSFDKIKQQLSSFNEK